MKTQKQHARRSENSATTFKCNRTVVGLVDRLSGMPVENTIGSESGNASIPVNNAMLVIGFLRNKTQHSPEFARVGFYRLSLEGPRLRYAINLKDRTPSFDKAKINASASGLSDLSAFNWIYGALFGEFPAGMYERKESSLEVAGGKTRSFFGSERQWTSAVEMFGTYMSGYSVPEMELIKPSTFPALLRSHPAIKQLSDETLTGVTHIYSMSRTELRSHTVNRLVQSIRSLPQEIRTKIITGYHLNMRSLDAAAAGKLRANDAQQASQNIATWIAGFPQAVLSQAYKAGADKDTAEVAFTDASHAASLLEEYTKSEPKRAISMYVPKSSSQQAGYLFKDPSLVGVSGVPLQIVSGFTTDGKLPYEGEFLFE